MDSNYIDKLSFGIFISFFNFSEIKPIKTDPIEKQAKTEENKSSFYNEYDIKTEPQEHENEYSFGEDIPYKICCNDDVKVKTDKAKYKNLENDIDQDLLDGNSKIEGIFISKVYF